MKVTIKYEEARRRDGLFAEHGPDHRKPRIWRKFLLTVAVIVYAALVLLCELAIVYLIGDYVVAAILLLTIIVTAISLIWGGGRQFNR